MSYSTTIRPHTLAELRSSGWQSKTVKQEIHDNFLTRLQNGDTAGIAQRWYAWYRTPSRD